MRGREVRGEERMCVCQRETKREIYKKINLQTLAIREGGRKKERRNEKRKKEGRTKEKKGGRKGRKVRRKGGSAVPV